MEWDSLMPVLYTKVCVFQCCKCLGPDLHL
jgi:hypothetical protein